METNTTIRVAIVDDHPMVREGLRGFLQLASDIHIVKDLASADEAIDFTDNHEVDVILMDLVMPGVHDGIHAIQVIKRACPSVQLIALTSFQDSHRTLAAIEAGAISYLQKDVSPDDLLYAIRQAHQGRSVLEPTALQALIRAGNSIHQDHQATSKSPQAPLIEPLTQREQEVLGALAEGKANKEIAADLGITEKTVKVHVSHILSKLGVYDRTQAIIAASRLGLITLQ